MHVLIVNFNLKDLSEEGYRQLCDEVAPAFATVPGLISKTWLADPDSNTYGGVYLWESREAYEAFAQSDLFRSVASDPTLANITARDFAVLEEPTRVTRGLATAAA